MELEWNGIGKYTLTPTQIYINLGINGMDTAITRIRGPINLDFLTNTIFCTGSYCTEPEINRDYNHLTTLSQYKHIQREINNISIYNSTNPEQNIIVISDFQKIYYVIFVLGGKNAIEKAICMKKCHSFKLS